MTKDTFEKSLLDRLQAGIASAVVTATLQGGKERPSEEKVLGVCDDFLKRVRCYHDTLIREARPLEEEHNRLVSEVSVEFGKIQARSRSLKETLQNWTEFTEGENAPKFERIEELKAVLAPLEVYANWVQDYFWIELKSRVPAAEKPDGIGIRSDWSIVEIRRKESPEKDISSLLAELMAL